MNFRATAALLAVLIVLGGIVYYVTQSPPPPASGAAPTPVAIVKLSAPLVTKLVLTGGAKTTELAKKGDAWVLARPTSEPADAPRIVGWVDQLANLSADRTLDDVTDLGSFGLADPKLKLEIDLSDGKIMNLQFGDKSPDGSSYYVRLPDDASRAKTVYLVGSPLGDDLVGALNKPPIAVPTPTPFPTLVPTTRTPSLQLPAITTTLTPGG